MVGIEGGRKNTSNPKAPVKYVRTNGKLAYRPPEAEDLEAPKLDL